MAELYFEQVLNKANLSDITTLKQIHYLNIPE